MLTLNTNENIQSQVQILTYGCLDIDSIKTTIPDNCATQTEIDNAVNAVNAGQRFKLFTSQYNITSQNMHIYYKNIMIFTYSDYSMSTIINTQLQTTSVKQGLIFQSEQNFAYPIQYSQINQSISRQSALQSGDGAYSFVTLQIDESVEKIYIQYTTLPQILALVNRNIQDNKDNFSEIFIYFQENSNLPIFVPVFQNKKKSSLEIEQFTLSPLKISENTNTSPINNDFEFKVQKIPNSQNRKSLSSSSNLEILNKNLKQINNENTKLDFYLQKKYYKQQSIQNQQQSILNTIKNSNCNLQLKTKIGENNHKSVDFEFLQQKFQNIQSLSISEKLKKIVFNKKYCSKKNQIK
ncbi:hypothetical protein TTHERM_000401919 (macronuclear) [Tetrahymena thermophila SB210]|uniref:Uncharacterized protein n=1 Tax=Tetrahymena thermophila (strain SB210) TaxID=312017 RepID=W7XKC8_TETTS|nr:hypothetical protein TTHERM_000401919 [Tetrahymena thermophila SB210]EWS74789.1 hypothetical protein TTHERM_000401919 [Tetrahymena thermophila SB210]|eukprot:XP_012652682.1 hypothetical protein TTHERM_000401919 [Tetrahymena thermophila SB210]